MKAMYPRTRWITMLGHRPLRIVVAVVLTMCGFALATSSAAAASFTWSGATPLGSGASNWSDGANWAGAAPSGTVETLTFPTLTSGACTAKPPTDTCYMSNNNVSGLSVNAISIDDSAGYNIFGEAITLGGGGIAASTSSSTPLAFAPYIRTPITLGASQTWSIDGHKVNGQVGFGSTVTGTSMTLAIDLTNGGGMDLQSDVEAGAVTVTGGSPPFPEFVALFPQVGKADLNGTDGHPVTFTGGASIIFAHGASSIGPLTMTGGSIETFTGETGTLAVNGGVTLDPTSTFSPNINKAGTTAGTDYSQLSASGTVNLASAKISLSGVGFPEGGGTGFCPTLHPGDVDALLTTTGSLTGTFAGVPDGTTVSVNCQGAPGTPATVRINYTAQAVTATVVTSGGTGSMTTTTLGALPASPVTNQAVTLTATVTPNAPTPSGTVSFENHGTPIAGCESKPVTLVGSAYIATCQTTFTAASSPEALTAVFTPASDSGLAGSTSPADNLTVGLDSTATALSVSNATPGVGASVTYTATVTPGHAGLTEPLESVEFLDGGTPIGGCASEPLTTGGSSSTATCTLSYPAAGSHSITAAYLADLNFTGSSSSPAQTVTVQAPPSPAPAPVLAQRETVGVVSGTATVRLPGTTTFVPLSGSTAIPDGSEVDATSGHVLITVATANGQTASAEVYGGRFRIHQDATGETHFILTLPLTGCPRVPLPHGSAAALAASAKHGSGPKSRHLWVSEHGGSWGTNGRYVSTTVEGTTWLTLDGCTRSEVKVAAGKVKVLDLVRRKTKTVSAGHSYVATAKRRRHA
jgi:Bacterial Ig-like domain (group 3)